MRLIIVPKPFLPCLFFKPQHEKKSMLLPPKPPVVNPSDYFNLLRLKIPETERTCRLGELTAEFKKPDAYPGPHDCEVCGIATQGVQGTVGNLGTKVLILVLPRFNANSKRMMKFPLSFNAREYFRIVHEDRIYHLYGVMYHIGEGWDFGHYVARCKSAMDDNWYLFDDGEVPEPIYDIPYKDACILFYSKSNREEHVRVIKQARDNSDS